MALVHGGQLQQVAKQYNIPTQDWLDLSTGIAPISYPIPNIPLSAWQQLPQYNEALIDAAKQYYQCSKLLVTNGSQTIIKALSTLYQQQNANSKHVYLPERGYKEHAQAWKVAGYELHFYQDSLPELTQLPVNCVLVIINPNNPTGQFFKPELISPYHSALKKLNGLLVIDEAFIDVMPNEQSYCPFANDNHVLVLRSFGKFFGLAGIRIGFLIANEHWCNTFKELLGPWQVNNPAQIIAEQALVDTNWQKIQKAQLKQLATAQEQMFNRVFESSIILDIKGCDLFLTLSFKQPTTAKQLYHLLCQQAVYCRLADEEDTLRFGIVTTDSIKRLEKALQLICTQFIFLHP
jgi:cobalamin biosynthetic protein CobC